MGKALAGLLVAVATGLLVYRLAAPHFLAPAPSSVSASPTPAPAESAPLPTTSNASNAPIAAPRTSLEQQRYALETKRAPFYRKLRDSLGGLLADTRPTDDDQAILELVAAQDSEDTTLTLVNAAIAADLVHYGFRHIRVYLPNPSGSPDRYRLDAEAAPDEQGNWQTFRK